LLTVFTAMTAQGFDAGRQELVGDRLVESGYRDADTEAACIGA